ncbi:MAG TPA: SMP-30/gluconolactonase/LRE family protein, partial [Hyphomicrobiales bacterium]|nr:SMP-30/gluconolactonase/LRE family protein [Hyphomicrobiales bacterium]
MSDVEVLIQEPFKVGESPVWDAEHGRLLFCDALAGTIHAIDPKTRARRVWEFGAHVGSFGLAQRGRWVVAIGCAVHLFDPATGKSELLVQCEPERPEWRLNDGKVGPDGAFWVGTMGPRGMEPVGTLYRVTTDGRAEKKIEGLRITNGLAWSPDGRTMYHAETRTRAIDAWDFDATTGAIANPRRFPSIPDEDGAPDGAATDSAGDYWAAGLWGSRINRFAPDGRLVGHLPVPVTMPTMPCFGGDDMRTLFITSLSQYASDEVKRDYPLTGSLLMT